LWTPFVRNLKRENWRVTNDSNRKMISSKAVSVSRDSLKLSSAALVISLQLEVVIERKFSSKIYLKTQSSILFKETSAEKALLIFCKPISVMPSQLLIR